VIRVKNRGRLQAHLAKTNITTQIHYPIPLHLQAAYATLGHKKGDFPVTEKAAEEILSLPMYPQLKPQQQKVIAQELINSLVGVTAGIGNPNLEPAAAPEGRAD
jgi:dTDP-4-amino-4,6-dideoxygalactose transaminase